MTGRVATCLNSVEQMFEIVKTKETFEITLWEIALRRVWRGVSGKGIFSAAGRKRASPYDHRDRHGRVAHLHDRR